MFNCDCCGLCCMNLKMSPLYADLDRGDGICKHFDVRTKFCLIYANRPEKCNIDKVYKKYYSSMMSKEKFYKLNYEICDKFKKDDKNELLDK